MIRVAGIVRESITDGEGLRLVIFAQGCAHSCQGCHNPETHSFQDGYLADDEEIIEMILKNPRLDGVTFSGGDPFFQADAFHKLAISIRERVTPHFPHFTIIAYTGFTYEKLMENSSIYFPLLSEIDVLIDGPYLDSKRTLDLNFAGSSNQRTLNMKETLKMQKPVLYVM